MKWGGIERGTCADFAVLKRKMSTYGLVDIRSSVRLANYIDGQTTHETPQPRNRPAKEKRRPPRLAFDEPPPICHESCTAMQNSPVTEFRTRPCPSPQPHSRIPH